MDTGLPLLPAIIFSTIPPSMFSNGKGAATLSCCAPDRGGGSPAGALAAPPPGMYVWSTGTSSSGEYPGTGTLGGTTTVEPVPTVDSPVPLGCSTISGVVVSSRDTCDAAWRSVGNDTGLTVVMYAL
jgi:hypothetical protein